MSDPGAGHTVENTNAAPVGPAREDLLPRGTAIHHYVLLEQLGAGGMGVVYAAYDYRLDRRVALKLVHDGGGAAAHARLLREAQVLAKLSHPNVVAVYDAGEHDGEVYIAMELVEGSSLRAWLAAAPRAWRAILDVFRRAGAGLAAAHGAGIVHRDVKPDNILIDRGGAVRVGDFGLASVAPLVPDGERAPLAAGSAATLTGAAMGTPPYMSPEQHDGRREIDARSDQFGFCVALYEALYGVRPFGGDDSAALRAAIEAGRLAAPETGQDTPAWIRRAIVRGLAADPAARFPSMTALLDELARDPRVRRRRWAIAGAALTASAAITFGAAWLAGGTDAGAACAVDDTRFAGVWDPPRRAAMRVAFSRSGAPAADDVWPRVERALDARTAAWHHMRTEACEATHVRAEQSAELLDRRMACLDDRATDLRALTDLLVVANRATVDRALGAIGALPPLEACGRSAALRAGKRATDAGAAERRDRLSRAYAASQFDRPRALELMRALANDARTASDPQLEAEVQHQIGKLLLQRGELDAAQDAFYRAIAGGVASDAQQRVTDAWLNLAWLTGMERGHYAEAHQLAAVAQAMIDRFGAELSTRGLLESCLGMLRLGQAKYAEAAPHLERALALNEQAFGPTSVQAARSLDHLGGLRHAEGNYEQALALIRRARAYRERELGPTSFAIVSTLGNEGVVLSKLERNDEALAVYQRGLAAALRNDPNDVGNAANFLNNISSVQRKQGKYAESQATLERALAMYERANGPDSIHLAAPLNNLALALADRKQYAAALPRLERAVAISERVLGPDEMQTADYRAGLGELLLEMGRAGQAIEPLERAMAVLAKFPSQAKLLAQCRFWLARALVIARNDRKRAFELADAARAGFAAASDTVRTKRVDDWRAEVTSRAPR